MELTYIPLGSVLDDDEVMRDLAGFDCGAAPFAAPLNVYARNRVAERDERARVASTYLAYDTDGGELVGYVTLTWVRVEDRATIRTWFLSMNPLLEDDQPERALARDPSRSCGPPACSRPTADGLRSGRATRVVNRGRWRRAS